MEASHEFSQTFLHHFSRYLKGGLSRRNPRNPRNSLVLAFQGGVLSLNQANVNLLNQKKGKKTTVFWSEVFFCTTNFEKKIKTIQGFPYTNPVKCQNIFFFLKKSMDFNDSKRKLSGFEPQKQRVCRG